MIHTVKEIAWGLLIAACLILLGIAMVLVVALGLDWLL
jgi:formate-dependent nitrite reductase membrane component NrfD